MSLSQSFSQKIGNVRPLNPCPSLDIDFANGGYVNTGGFANQESVGSANFKIGAFNGPDPIFTRATAATFRGSNGLIQYAPENLIAQSENLTGNNWTVTNTTVASSASISPTGSSSFVVTEIAATGAHAFGNMGGTVANSLAVTSGTVYTGSFFIKKNSAVDWVQINFGGFGFGTIQYANFNLSTGVIGNYAGLAGSPKIENCGNGWYRCSISVAATATTTTNTAFIAFTNNLDQAVRSPSYAGSTSNSVLVTMLQLERSSAARPYISTTALPVYGPRFEYDLNGEPLGLLMEEQSQNLVYPSSTLTTQTRTVTAAPHTLSFYGTGSVSLSGATTGTVIGSGANTRTVYTFTPTAGSLTLTVSGSVTSAQLEQKPFATSYMPTVGGPMTRNADVVNSTIGSWFNQPEGTIVVSGDRSHSPSLNTSLYDSFYEFNDGGGGYHSTHFSDGTAEEFFGDNGAYVTSAVGIATIGTLTSIASSYSSNDIYTTRDGVAPNSAVSATFLATPITLNIGYSQAITQAWNGHIKTFRYYPKALPNNLQRLSS